MLDQDNTEPCRSKKDRVKDLYPETSPDAENEMDTRNVARQVLRGKDHKYRSTDKAQFVLDVERIASGIEVIDLSDHILFKSIDPNDAKDSLLLGEVLYWDISSETPLDESAAQAIVDMYERLQQILREIHEKMFPLHMTGYPLGHMVRTAIYAALIAQEMGEDPVLAAQAVFCHDLGKLENEQGKLTHKNGKLDDDEFEKVKQHPYLTSTMLEFLYEYEGGRYFPIKNISHERYLRIREAGLKHHIWDNNDKEKSYPKYVATSQDMIVKIITVADAFDAMTARKYNNRDLSMKERIQHAYIQLQIFEGYQFARKVVQALSKVRPQPDIKKLKK